MHGRPRDDAERLCQTGHHSCDATQDLGQQVVGRFLGGHPHPPFSDAIVETKTVFGANSTLQ